MTEQELVRRTPLWVALADLLLDTDMPELWSENIARAMRSGGFNLAETRLIFLEEVGPVRVSNLFSVAGAWQGWDADAVVRDVLHRQQRPKLWRYGTAKLLRPVLTPAWRHIEPHLHHALLKLEQENQSA